MTSYNAFQKNTSGQNSELLGIVYDQYSAS